MARFCSQLCGSVSCLRGLNDCSSFCLGCLLGGLRGSGSLGGCHWQSVGLRGHYQAHRRGSAYPWVCRQTRMPGLIVAARAVRSSMSKAHRGRGVGQLTDPQGHPQPQALWMGELSNKAGEFVVKPRTRRAVHKSNLWAGGLSINGRACRAVLRLVSMLGAPREAAVLRDGNVQFPSLNTRYS